MIRSQQILHKCFPYAVVLFAAIFFTMLPLVLRSGALSLTSRFYAQSIWVKLYGLMLIAMRELVVLTPPSAAMLYGTAWWALRKGAPRARRWAVWASASSLALCAPFVVGEVLIVRYSESWSLVATTGLCLLAAFAAFGILGLVAFRERATLSAGSVRIADVRQPLLAVAPVYAVVNTLSRTKR